MARRSGLQDQVAEGDPLRESIWRSPLVFAALAVTAGIVLDRLGRLPFVLSVLGGAGCLVAFVVARVGGHIRLAPVYLALTGVALGAAYHHFRRDLCEGDDIGWLLRDEPVPVRIRGRVEAEPKRLPGLEKADPLRSLMPGISAATVVDVSSVSDGRGERTVSGRVRMVVTGEPRQGAHELLDGLHPGDEIEARGRLAPLAQPANPGEFDQTTFWRDQGVSALLLVRQGDAAVRKLRTGWATSFGGWIAVVRGWGHRVLGEYLPDRTVGGVARALLLGEGAPMTYADWAKYKRTGVIHVLAISGQHLVVVGFFLWWFLRLVGVRQRRAAAFVALILLGYALLTGGRPPALRAGVGACVLCLGMILRKPTQQANVMALAWLIVAMLNPTDVFDPGCQLSFLSVAILYWGAGWLMRPRPEDPLDTLVDRVRPMWLRLLRALGWMVFESYLVCLIVWIAIAPLTIYHYGMFATMALPLGPPLTLLTSIALFAGFVVLLLAPWFPPGAWLAARVVWASIAGCEKLVDLAETWALHVYVGPVPAWWVVLFYLLLLAVLTQKAIRQRWCWALPSGLAWLCVGLVAGAASPAEPILRCTFLAVGHGGCSVIQTPDGRVLLYDTGAVRGPDVTERIIAPYLWSQKVFRIDDVILSHADLDHFNGLLDLADRFAIGRVLCTPTFADKPTQAVRITLRELHRRRIPIGHLVAGQRLRSSGVEMDVLHPPAGWPGGNENTRSIVLEVRHGGHVLLLTGDLEGEGLAEVLSLRPRRVDVLMAPHHGSHRIDVTALTKWCRPGLVVSCQGLPRGAGRAPGMYRAEGAEFWSTQEQGAVELRSDETGLSARGYRSKREWRARER
jgi:competence protein ComEC